MGFVAADNKALKRRIVRRGRYCLLFGLVAETIDVASISFGWATVNFRRWFKGELSPHLLSFASRNAFSTFFVELSGLCGGASFFRECDYPDLPASFCIGYVQTIASFYFSGGFAGSAVEFDLATIDCVGSQAARFEEARSPQPFVNASAVHWGSNDSPA